MSLSALRTSLRTLVDDTYASDSELNDIISRATRKLERDFLLDDGAKPRQSMEYVELTVDTDGLELPADFLRARTVKIGNTSFRSASADKVGMNQQDGATVQLYYYTKVPDLTESTSNWVYDVAPDLMLYASALQWAIHYRAENLPVYDTMYSDALATVRAVNSAKPTGSWIQQKGRPYGGFYSIVGNTMRFA